jgi:hypothetical protein
MAVKSRVLRAYDLVSKRVLLSSRKAARVLANEASSPVTVAVKLWGDDEEPFRNLISSKTADAKQWRTLIRAFLRRIAADPSGRTVFRGWQFQSANALAGFLDPIIEARLFVNERVGMSASRSRRVSSSPEFLNRHGMLWEIRRPKSARDMEPIFSEIGAKYPRQREVIFPQGSRFLLVEPPRAVSVIRGGHGRHVPYLAFEEL